MKSSVKYGILWVLVKILQKYILKESLAPFLIGIFVFTMIFLFDKLFDLVDKLVGKGLTILLAGKLLLIIIPSFLVLTIPMAMLIASQLSMGRLAADNEITAMRSSGYNIFYLVLPLLLCGVLLSGCMLYFNNSVLPTANYAYRRLMFDIVHQRAASIMKERTYIDLDEYIIYISKLDAESGMMEGVHLYSVDKKNRSLQTTFSRFGRIITDESKLSITLRLLDGAIHWVNDTNLANYNRIFFNTSDINLDINRSLHRQQRAQQGSREMKLTEINKKLAEPSTSERYRHILRTEYHSRFSMPFACIAVVMIGAPMGLLSRRSGITGFFISLSVIFGYYVFMAIGEAVSQKGLVHPLIGCWLPNVVAALIGILLMLQATREHPLIYYLPAFVRRWFKGKEAQT